MKSMPARLAGVIGLVLLPCVLAQPTNTDYTWAEAGDRIEVADNAVITAADLAAFKGAGFLTFGVSSTTEGPVSTITWPETWNIPGSATEFEFSLTQIPYGGEMMSRLDPAINEDYLLSDLFEVSVRAGLGQTGPVSQVYQVTSTRVRDPEATLPIPVAAEERFGKVTYETGGRRNYIDAPLSCPAGFQYRLIDVDLPLDAANACRCPPSCTSTTATCDFSGSGRYAISVVPEWMCTEDDSTPAPRNPDDPINERAAIAAGVILSTLALCCLIITCMLCINAGPKDDHWNHAPRKPGAIPLPPDYNPREDKPVEEEAPMNPEGAKPPPRIFPDGVVPYSIPDAPAAMPPPVGAPAAPQLMSPPAPPLASPPMPDPFPQ